jgi:hypothetical protein
VEEGDGDLGVDMYAVRRVKRVGFQLHITREIELVRGRVGGGWGGGGHGEQAALAGEREGRRGEVASAGER